MEVICIKKPDKKNWLCTDVSVGEIYEVSCTHTYDYQLIDDKKNMRWYDKTFFEPLNNK